MDGRTSVDWIQRTGCRVINLLCKGSINLPISESKNLEKCYYKDDVPLRIDMVNYSKPMIANAISWCGLIMLQIDILLA